jgi:hypothetical protein
MRGKGPPLDNKEPLFSFPHFSVILVTITAILTLFGLFLGQTGCNNCTPTICHNDLWFVFLQEKTHRLSTKEPFF